MCVCVYIPVCVEQGPGDGDDGSEDDTVQLIRSESGEDAKGTGHTLGEPARWGAVTCGVLPVLYYVWCTTCGVLPVVYYLWCTTCGALRVVCHVPCACGGGMWRDIC